MSSERTASSDATSATSSASETTWSFRLVEPALTTRTAPTYSERPGPVADLGFVVAVLARVDTGPQPPIHQLLPELRGPRTEAGDAIDHVHDEVEAVEVVEHDDVEGRRRRALLLVATDVQISVARAPVGQAVDEPGVAV